MKFILLTFFICFANAIFALPVVQPDTVIIQIGEGEMIKIISNNEDELQRLSEFDLNAIIRDIHEKASGEHGQNVNIQVEDSVGQKYIYEKIGAESDSLSLEDKINRFSGRMEVLGDSLEKVLNREAKQRNYGTNRTLSLDVGLNNYLSNRKFPDESNALYAVNPLYSWYIAVGGVNKTHISGPFYIDWGANVSWYNFKFQNTRTRIKKTDAGLDFFIDDAVSKSVKSKLVVPYLNFSFVPLLNFGNRRRNDWLDYDNNLGFRIGVGGYAGYRLGSKSKYVYREDGDRERVKEHTNYFISNWRYGLRLKIGISALDFFVNYDLNNLFNEGKGPQLNAFSFGLVL